MSLLSDSLAGVARGWAFTPLKGKVPILKGWSSLPPANADDLKAWTEAGYNLGVRCGRVSGIVVVDVDRDEYASLGLPETWTVKTGGGRWHLYFAAPATALPRNSVGKVAPGVDIRSEGGQVVAVGSIHPDTGDAYIWHVGPSDCDLAPWPAGWAAPRASDSEAQGYGAAALAKECASVALAETGTRNDALNSASFSLGQLVAGNVLSRDAVRAKLADAAERCGLMRDEPEKTLATIERGLDDGASRPRGVPAMPTRTTDRPQVIVPGSHFIDGAYLEQGTDKFAAAVLDAIPEGVLYRRADIVGTIVGVPGSRRFDPLSESRCRQLVDEFCALYKGRPKKDDDDGSALIFQACSRDLASLVSDAARTHPKVRDLRALASFPMFRKDWSLSPVGYADGVFYDEPPCLVGVCAESVAPRQPGDPSPLDALDDALVDFPFKDAASRFNMIGLLLTPFIREAVGNVPLHLIHSSLERTGKTKLAEQVLGRVVLGRPTPALQLSGNDDERDKRILSLLLSGDSIAHLDNLREFVDSASLSSLLTSATYSGRLLGKSALVSLPNNLTLVATGNNVRATGEIAKRTIPILLQPRDSRPEDRSDFAHPNLPAFLITSRPALVVACLRLVLDWRTNGAAPSAFRLGGFEAWAEAVGGALAGTPWASNVKAWQRQANTDGEDLAEFVRLWHAAFSSMPVTASALADLAKSAGLFPRLFDKPSDRACQTSFSMRVLMKSKDMPIGDFVVRRDGSGSHSNWRLD